MNRSLSYHPRFLIVSTSMDANTPKGLANHAKSVSSYLYAYGCTIDRALRSEYSKSFFLYLLAGSWLKMHLRFSSWQALGFIQILEKGIGKDIVLTVKGFEDSFGSLAFPEELGPGDHTLAAFFSLNKQSLCAMMKRIGKILPSHRFYELLQQENPTPSESEELSENAIRLTLDIFDEAVELALKERKAFYKRKTAAIFHCILYLSLLVVGRALAKIKGWHDKLNTNPKNNMVFQEYKKAIQAAELPVRFLICMLSSRAFKSHMRVWTNEGVSIKPVLPIFEKKASYLSFGRKREILGPGKKGSSSHSSELEVEVEVESELIEVRELIC